MLEKLVRPERHKATRPEAQKFIAQGVLLSEYTHKSICLNSINSLTPLTPLTQLLNSLSFPSTKVQHSFLSPKYFLSKNITYPNKKRVLNHQRTSTRTFSY